MNSVCSNAVIQSYLIVWHSGSVFCIGCEGNNMWNRNGKGGKKMDIAACYITETKINGQEDKEERNEPPRMCNICYGNNVQ